MSNIFSYISFGLFAFSSVSQAADATASVTKICANLDLPVPVKVTNPHFDQPRVDSSIDAIDWTVNVTTWTTVQRIEYYVNITKQYNINAQLCVPAKKTSKSNILQIATPGLAFDKRYFDIEIRPDEFSYVDAAIKKGYSILTYDRLGTGASEKPCAYDDVQIPTEIEILAGLTKIARAGNLTRASTNYSNSSSHASLANFHPSKVVHIGHSFGSFVTSNMLGLYGNLSDGAILTGLYLNTKMKENQIDVLHYDHEFAKEHDPARFSEYGSGYFVLATKSDLQKLFFQKATLDPELLTYTESIKQPEAVGEYASEGTNPFLVASDFKGPIQLFIGELDNFICKGDCRNIFDEELTNKTYPHASHISHYLQPATGHALTPSNNASAGFEVMLQYLDSQGL